MIDHTLLKPDASEEAIKKLCDEAKEFHLLGRKVPACVHDGRDVGKGVAVLRGQKPRRLIEKERIDAVAVGKLQKHVGRRIAEAVFDPRYIGPRNGGKLFHLAKGHSATKRAEDGAYLIHFITTLSVTLSV